MTHRVLVVDDDAEIREITQFALEAVAGWEVIAVSSGAEALEKAASERPEAVLMDVMMPEMDGPTTLKRFRENEATASIPVIFLTANIRPVDKARFERLGAAGVISKPFDAMTLAEGMRKLLGWD